SPRMASLQNLMLWCGQLPPPAVPAASGPEHPASAPDEEKDSGEDDAAAATDEMVDPDASLHSQGEFHAYQLLTNTFLHAGLLHLAGNLLFLMVLGSRVNALIGNVWTSAVYPILGIAASWVYLIASAHDVAHPALGASGAIMGLAG